jgi:hypothetical protein
MTKQSLEFFRVIIAHGGVFAASCVAATPQMVVSNQ